MTYQIALELGGTNFSATCFNPAFHFQFPPISGAIKDFRNLDNLLSFILCCAGEPLQAIDRIIITSPSPNKEGIIPNTINGGKNCAGFHLGQETSGEWQGVPFVVINDFVAAAHATADFNGAPPVWFGDKGVENLQNRVCYIIGPGTGLGQASCIIKPKDNFLAVRGSEGQHVYMPQGDFHFPGLTTQIYRQLQERTKIHGSDSNMPNLTAEEIVSGRGLCRIYNGLCSLRGDAKSSIGTPVEVVQAAANDNPLAREALSFFFFTLGRAAANLAVC